MANKKAAGHFAAILTILIWGTTFVSTKILLESFQPAEILLIRFVLGLLALTAACPKHFRTNSRKEELYIAAAGLAGVGLYYLIENIALTLTTASNVGVIISAAPLFTALLGKITGRPGERHSPRFFAGFAIAMAGIILISINTAERQMNPAGDALALLAAFVWGIYCVLTKKISTFAHPVILTTRRSFFYGIICILPTLFFSGFHTDFSRFADFRNIIHLFYLGLGASALCFVTWNFAVKRLGAVKTSVYIYLVPVITVLSSALILNEHLSPAAIAGTALTLAGLAVSEYKKKGI